MINVIKYFKNIDPVIILILFTILFYLLTRIEILPIYKTDTISTTKDYTIQIQKDYEYPVVYQFNNNELPKELEYASFEKTVYRNGRKYLLNNNNKTIKTSEINGKHKIALGIPININTAKLEELTALPSIGQVTANNIIDYRIKVNKITDLEDLINVDGIGRDKINKIKELIEF